MTIREALNSLAPSDDKNWSTIGKPRLSAVSALVGKKVTRKDIDNVDSTFTRSIAEARANSASEKGEKEANNTEAQANAESVELDFHAMWKQSLGR